MAFSDRNFFAPPSPFVLLIMLANVGAYLFCLRAAGTPALPSDLLLKDGALIPSTLATHAYWRLFAYGFLHANPAHLLMNMFSLIILGPHLERQLGPSYFLIIYFGALVSAGLVSLFAHGAAPFVSVGASGAIYGILAALFALWVLGKSELSPFFFLINFTLNFAFSARSPEVDWAAHIGGFIAGVGLCASLDLAEKFNSFWLRCKFPEFAKFNVLILIAISAAVLSSDPPKALQGFDIRIIAASWLIASLCLIKIVDLVLSVKHGLAPTVAILAVADALFAFLLVEPLIPFFAAACTRPWASPPDPIKLTYLQTFLCAYASSVPIVSGIIVGLLVMIVFRPHVLRGLKDTGFVAPTLLADRRRQQGLG